MDKPAFTECQQCGQMLRMHWSEDGRSGHSDPHTCGAPSVEVIRRIVREEIEAAIKRALTVPAIEPWPKPDSAGAEHG